MPSGALNPSDDDLEMRRRVDRALDTAAQRLCGGILLVVLMFGAYFAGNWHCLPDSSGHGCGSLRWVAVTLKRQLPSTCVPFSPIINPMPSLFTP